jgi:hypothetical protein
MLNEFLNSVVMFFYTGNTKAKKLRRGGTLFARITKAPEMAGKLHLKLRGVKLKNAGKYHHSTLSLCDRLI